MLRVALGTLVVACVGHLAAAEIHVALSGNDSNPGTAAAPLRSVQRAAQRAQPGDVITVHEGIYRERINPPRGGESDSRRIVYQAAPGEKVEIRGSEVVNHWVKVGNDTWKATLPSTFFGGFNPYADLVRGDWFTPLGREHHTGAVYLNGQWLIEAPRLDDVLLPAGEARIGPANRGNAASRVPLPDALRAPLWFAKVDAEQTTIWAQFPGVDPNKELVEINARQSVFYPDKPGRNFITVRGFALRHAATPWAPPTAEQIGLIGTHWSKGWIIENNVVSHSICSGIALGKHGDQFDNTSANTAEGYVKTIERAHAHAIPWTKENIGHHIVRNNTISHCEQTAIVGSLGSAFSTVVNNTIHDIHVRKLFTGAEMAGIKFHAAIDTEIRGNRIFRTCRGLWLDWMAQGTRVSQNLFYDNDGQDVFVEVNHGPFVFDNNLLLSATSLLDWSEGGAYIHNLFAGQITCAEEPGRQTPYHPAHATAVAGLSSIRGGDNRFYNNLFIGKGVPASTAAPKSAKADRRRATSGFGLWVYDERSLPLFTGGNVYLNGARPYAKEVGAIVLSDFNPNVRRQVQSGRVCLELDLPRSAESATRRITSEILGQAAVPGLPYVQPDGQSISIDADYFGKPRGQHPVPGPFETTQAGAVRVELP